MSESRGTQSVSPRCSDGTCDDPKWGWLAFGTALITIALFLLGMGGALNGVPTVGIEYIMAFTWGGWVGLAFGVVISSVWVLYFFRIFRDDS